MRRPFERWPRVGSSTHPRRYLTCTVCGHHRPPRVAWSGATLTACCPACNAVRQVPRRWPWLELAQRADFDVLLIAHEARRHD